MIELSILVLMLSFFCIGTVSVVQVPTLDQETVPSDMIDCGVMLA